MIRLGVRRLWAAGKHFVCNILGEPGLPRIIKSEDPEAIVCYRANVTGTHDADPENGGNWLAGQQRLDACWSEMQQVGLDVVDYWVLANEWGANVTGLDFVQKFVRFYCQLIDACLARHVKCTICDFASGHPGYPTIPHEAQWLEQLIPLFRKAEAAGIPVGWHTYDLLDEHGNRMPREITLTRFEAYVAQFPNLVIIGTEGGNSTKDGTPDDGMFRGDDKRPTTSKEYMQQHYALVKDKPQLMAICWWEICWPDMHRGPEANWALDDWTSIWDWYVEFMCTN